MAALHFKITVITIITITECDPTLSIKLLQYNINILFLMSFNHICETLGYLIWMGHWYWIRRLQTVFKHPQQKIVCMQIFSIQIKKWCLGRSHYSWNIRTKMYFRHHRQISNYIIFLEWKWKTYKMKWIIWCSLYCVKRN